MKYTSISIGCASKLYLCEDLCFVWCRYSKTRCVFEEKSETCLKKNQTTPRPSEPPPVMGGEMSKRLGGIKRLQIMQNLFMAFKQVPRCR